MVSSSKMIYDKYGFEMPITITLVQPYQVVSILTISFNKNLPNQKDKASHLYEELNVELAKKGIYPYRSGILGMDKISFQDLGKNATFKILKNSLDPNNIISPGGYGIG